MLAGTILVALTFYALMGGADYGAGVWSLLARGARSGDQRAVIASAIGPIWEANHVWLILVVTVLFTAFPKAFALISTTLHIPLTLMLIGIVLRGSAFAFRTHDIEARKQNPDTAEKFWEMVFALSSVFTPVLLGITIGAIASGRLAVTNGTFLDVFVRPWFTPFALSVGLLALALFAFLAAVYLIVEAREPDVREDFRRRALWAALTVGLLAAVVFALSGTGAPEIREGLGRSVWGRLVLVAAGGLWGGAVGCLWTRRYRLGRMCTAGHVALILWGWALAQFPYLVEPNLTIVNAAAPPQTLRLLLLALVAGGVLLFPSLYYLYRIFKSGPVFGRER